MTKLFEITLRHDQGESRFINCSIDNAMNFIQTDIYMRGINYELSIPVFWDIVFKRYQNLKVELFDLVNNNQITIKKTYR